ncbi:MAG: glycosyltransferase [Patescibacteria group bacterium]
MNFPENPTTSWVIRTKNEEKWLPKVLETLFLQSRLDFEIIIVDSGSTDSTLDIVKDYPVRSVINILPDQFNYSYALNLGINESWGEYIGIISAHSLPTSRDWYREAIKNFRDPLVACVGGQYTSLPDGSYDEKLGDIIYHIKRVAQGDIYTGITKDQYFEEITNTNCLIRKKLWNSYNFDEELEGSEDFDWAMEMRSRGYKTVFDPIFNVYHSHGGINRPTIEQMKGTWSKTKRKIESKVRPSVSISKVFNK